MKSIKKSSLQFVVMAALGFFSGAAANVSANPKHEPSATAYWSQFKQDASQKWDDSNEAFRDGWIEGKVSYALAADRFLTDYDLSVTVDDNVATLTGAVDTKVERELAETVALSIEGIEKVDNQIEVKKVQARPIIIGIDRTFSEYFNDVTTTATIKTDLIKSPNVSGVDINVDTYKQVVTLSGNVESMSQKALAEAIAKKSNSVDKVVNKIVIRS
jgi:osmotically-inducible protein OsmY